MLINITLNISESNNEKKKKTKSEATKKKIVSRLVYYNTATSHITERCGRMRK